MNRPARRFISSVGINTSIGRFCFPIVSQFISVADSGISSVKTLVRVILKISVISGAWSNVVIDSYIVPVIRIVNVDMNMNIAPICVRSYRSPWSEVGWSVPPIPGGIPGPVSCNPKKGKEYRNYRIIRCNIIIGAIHIDITHYLNLGGTLGIFLYVYDCDLLILILADNGLD